MANLGEFAAQLRSGMDILHDDGNLAVTVFTLKDKLPTPQPLIDDLERTASGVNYYRDASGNVAADIAARKQATERANRLVYQALGDAPRNHGSDHAIRAIYTGRGAVETIEGKVEPLFHEPTVQALAKAEFGINMALEGLRELLEIRKQARAHTVDALGQQVIVTEALQAYLDENRL